MNRTRHRKPGAAGQRGAALVVGLVLLVILTLLAISGMNTATTELSMAGNQQFHENAFQAAETGIERTISAGVFNPSAPVVTVNAVLNDDGNADTVDNGYTARTLPRGPSAAPPGYSLDQFSSEHFEIRSTGTAARNASTALEQGLYLVVPKPN